MQEKKERTMKENYDAITQILIENNKKIVEIDFAINKIKDIHRVVIPILKAFEEPKINGDYKQIEGSYIHTYEMSLTRRITFSRDPVVCEGNEQTIQKWLDKYSPIKLKVESIESQTYPYGDYVITVSLV